MTGWLAIILLGLIGGLTSLLWSIDRKLGEIHDVLQKIAAKEP